MTADSERMTTDRAALELQHLRVEVEKLSLEVDVLRSSTRWERLIGRYLPIATALLAIATFWFSVYDHHSGRVAAEVQRANDLSREVARPFSEQQL